ncbi:hypothetical protein AAKU67_003230 [Oxalobacteraceae bacterium GrIS 2.11]
MLRSLDDLKQYAIHATDGDIGAVRDFYFDDQKLAIRYLVVETGGWLMGRSVLITPISIGKPDWDAKTLPVKITMEQVKNSPDINTDKPVSRQIENEYLGYYGYPIYWEGAGLWGTGLFPGMALANSATDIPVASLEQEHARPQHQNNDSHLRSCKEVIGYHIHASDGEIGHVSGMLVDEKTWAIRYLVVDTSNWWIGHKVLIPPLWIGQIKWPAGIVTVNLTRAAVQESLPYDDSVKLDRDYETAMHQHYGRTGYWEDEGSDDSFDPYD